MSNNIEYRTQQESLKVLLLNLVSKRKHINFNFLTSKLVQQVMPHQMGVSV